MYNKSVTKIGICRRQRRRPRRESTIFILQRAVLWLEMELLFIVGGI